MFKDSVIYSISIALSRGLGFVLLPFYTRVLSPAEYGVMDLIAISAVLVTNIVSAQLTQSLFRYYVDEDEGHSKAGCFTTVLLYYLGAFTLAVIPIILWRDVVSTMLFDSVAYGDVIGIAALNIFAAALFTLFSNVYRLDFQARKFGLISIVHMGLTAGTIIALVSIFDMGIMGVFIGQLAVHALMCLVLAPKAWRLCDASAVSFAALKKFLRFGLPLLPGVMILLVMQYTDRVMITNMIGVEALGVYAVGLKIASIITLLFAGFQLAWSPHIFANHRDTATRDLMRDVFYYLSLFCLILVSALVLFSPEILSLIAGPEYHMAYQVMPILALSAVFFAIGTEFSLGFAIANRNEVQSLIYFVAIFINIGLNLYLIPLYGLVGAATATMLSFFLSGITNLYLSNRFYRLEFKLKKMTFFISHFLFITLAYVFSTGELGCMTKIGLLVTWIIPLLLMEKSGITRLWGYIRQ